MKLTERNVITALRLHGYKLTQQRREVVRTIASCPDHLTPVAIYRKLRRGHHSIGLATIYRTLEILAELKLICELYTRDKYHSYIISVPQHHHHLICSNCGKVFDFTSHNLSELERGLSKESGFRIDSHQLEFTGLCQTCQKIAQD